MDLSVDCEIHPSLASPQQISNILKSSKADVFREGDWLLITCSPSPLCAVTAQLRTDYLEIIFNLF